MKERVLIVDDSVEVRALLQRMLEQAAYEVESVASLAEFRARLNQSPPDVVLLDWKLSDGDGVESLPAAKSHWPDTQVIVITGFGTFDAAVEATKLGAFHFVAKPFDVAVLLSLVRRACEFKHLHDHTAALQRALAFLAGGASPVFRSPAIKAVLRLAEKLAAQADPVLITGEAGVGKEVLARLIHALGARLNQPFFKVNCGAMSQLSRGLFGWELFGSATGRASTPGQPSDRGLLREAGSGTVLLDEITALPDQSQVLLEQVVRTRRFVAFGGQAEQELACRVLATTCRNAEAAVLGKELREDLFKAVSAATLHVPALRERREDILPLADAFLQRFAAQAQRVVKGFTPAAAATLERFDWPGNVRQLENLIQSVVLTTDSDLVDVEHLPFGIRAEVARKTMAGH